MNILSYIKYIKDKVDNIHETVSDPIYLNEKSHNPFLDDSNKTFVWIEKEDDNNSS